MSAPTVVITPRFRLPSSAVAFWFSAWRTPFLGLVLVILIMGTAVAGPLGLVAAGGLCVMLAVIIHPPTAAYVMVGVAPWVIGFERGDLIPVMRPNEGLLVALWGALCVGWLLRGEVPYLPWGAMEWSLLAMGVFGSIVPLLVATGRIVDVDFEAVMYATTLWKLFALYYLFRVVLRTEAELRTVGVVLLVTASALSILALFDGLNLLGTAQRLNDFFPVAEEIIDDGRGAGTIGNAIGMAGFAALAFFVALAMALYRVVPLWFCGVAGLATLLGVFGSGQTTGPLAVVVGVVALGAVSRRFTQLLLWSVPAVLIVALATLPLIERRIEGFDSTLSSQQVRSVYELPAQLQPRARQAMDPGSSWEVRVYNLDTYFLPSFDELDNVLLGVDPVPRADPARANSESIWIESGYIWLLWIGGVPFVISFVVFLYVAARLTRHVALHTKATTAAFGAAAFGSVAAIGAMQALDPHLTLRGSADAFFPILALGVAGLASPVVVNPRGRP